MNMPSSKRLVPLIIVIMMISISSPFAYAEQELTLDGYELSTTVTGGSVTPDTLVINLELPNDTFFFWPYFFEGESFLATVTATFEGSNLPVINGDIIYQDDISYLTFDIEGFEGQTGDLSIELTSTSNEPAVLFLIIDVINLDTDNDGFTDLVEGVDANGEGTVDTDSDGITDDMDTDSDNDGMSDAYEFIYGLNRIVNDAALDKDGDGFSNLAEFIAGTNPTAFDIPDGDVTALIAAINTANNETSNPGVDIIELATNGSYSLISTVDTSSGNSGLPAITSEIIIKGNNASISGSSSANTPCDGSGDEFRILLVNLTGALTLNNTTISGGCTLGLDGSGITVNGGSLLNLNNSSVLNTSGQADGGIHSNAGSVTISR